MSANKPNTTSEKESAAQPKKTGRYVYDKKTGEVVKVSDDIPSINKAGHAPCGGSCCSGGGAPSCPSMDDCGGGCCG